MSKSKEATITYIKNGKKITHKLHWHNKNIILNKFFPNKKFLIQIPEDIEWIHFENCEFQYLDKSDIKVSSNTTCIFENCTFSNDRMLSRNLFLSGGKIELINPDFINIDAIFIKNKSDYVQKGEREWIDNYEGEVTIKFDEKYSKKIDYLDIAAGKVNVINNDVINDLHVSGNSINLSKNFNLDYCSLKGDKIFIGGTEKENTIISVQHPSIHIKAKEKLELKNCVIKSKTSVAIQPTDIEIENFTIKSKKIIIDRKIYRLDEFKKYDTTKNFLKFLEKPDGDLYSKDNLKKSKNDFEDKKNFENTLESLHDEQLEQITSPKKRR